MNENTLFLRLEGAMQAWGDHQSKFVVRRTAEAPTKSGVIGMLCAALGVTREDTPAKCLPRLSELRMGVRIDAPGIRWWDYHTVGAKMMMRKAEGGVKLGAMLSRREYLCDASFLVALQGDSRLVAELDAGLHAPFWPLYLGRKSCPPSRPITEHPPGAFPDILPALASIPWRRRMKKDRPPEAVACIYDWAPSPDHPTAPDDAPVWFDAPLSFAPPSHSPRFVIRESLSVGPGSAVPIADEPAQSAPRSPPRPRANYKNSEYKRRRGERLDRDHNLCVFCKAPATTVQHITYRRAGGNEAMEDLRALCRLCHDAVTMIEYGEGMGMDRINPEDPRWRDLIIEKRAEIVKFRSLETRRRCLSPEEVE